MVYLAVAAAVVAIVLSWISRRASRNPPGTGLLLAVGWIAVAVAIVVVTVAQRVAGWVRRRPQGE